MSKLMDKLIKTTKIKGADVLSESKLFAEKETIVIPTLALNIALAGDIDGGLRSGLTSIAGPSRHFKTLLALLMASAYMKKYPEAILLFYDSEFGSPASYFKAVDIDVSRVLHIPITNIEELKFDIMQKFDNKNEDGIKRGDKVFVLTDSVGNLASAREADNAIEGNSAADMTRAKELKSLWRLVTPHLNLKNIPMAVIQHTYMEMKMYGKNIMSGGQGGMLSSDTVWIIGKEQEKDGKDLLGYTFNINIEKSRYVKEKSKIPILVTFDGGMSKYTGMLELAIQAGEVIKPKNARYQLVDKETGEVIGDMLKEEDTDNEEFLGVVVKRESFKQWVRDTYQLAEMKLVTEDEAD